MGETEKHVQATHSPITTTVSTRLKLLVRIEQLVMEVVVQLNLHTADQRRPKLH